MGFDLAMTHFVPGSARAALLASKPKIKDATTPDHKADQEKKQNQSVSVKIGAVSPSSSNGAGGSSGNDLDVADLSVMPGELQSARAQTSGLNEELGLVKFIATDKTGTLTCNRMDVRKAFIGQLQYGTGTTDLQAAVRAAQLASRTKAEIAARGRCSIARI